ncbi:toll/interleukin-1 receptor domain-containing protein [Sorangium sp. So ce281]|uniref:toll/interleukin-1 receptor domain-containing protein n=1 Tax=unclassified Sorangium TaxID=2621164 RepID=UPI003F640B22
MGRPTDDERFLSLVPVDGSTISNRSLREHLGWPDEKYERVRDQLVERGLVIRGPGPGGTVRRADTQQASEDDEQDDAETHAALSRQEKKFLSLIPEDGSTINNRVLREQLGWNDEKYAQVRDQLVERGLVIRGPGPGGTVRRADTEQAGEDDEQDDAEIHAALSRQEKKFLSLIPEDGSTINNRVLREQLGWNDEKYAQVRDQLVERGLVIRGPGPGGTVRRADTEQAGEDDEQDDAEIHAALSRQEKKFLSLIPEDGSTINNRVLREQLGWNDERYAQVRDQLVERGLVVRGPGQGGTVRRADIEQGAEDDEQDAESNAALSRQENVPSGRGRGTGICRAEGAKSPPISAATPKPPPVSAATPKPRVEHDTRHRPDERAAPKRPIKIFIAYVQSDELLKKDLLEHLRPLEKSKLIEIWHDHMITPGEDWKGVLHQRLQEADIIIFLISPIFINSDYCNGDEMETALARHKSGEAVVVPVILRPCLWQLDRVLGRLRALPKDDMPVTKWSDRDDAFANIAHGIYDTVQKLLLKL